MSENVRYLIYGLYFLSLALLYSRYEFYDSKYNIATGLSYKKVMNNLGYYAEYQTYRRLKKYAKYGFALADVYIPKGDDKYTEVDIVFISSKGVIVVEVKNRSGFIIGDEVNFAFIQMSSNGTRHEIYNPIWQNRAHVSAVQDILDIKDPRYYNSLIVFGPETNNISVKLSSANLDVIMMKELRKFVKKYNKQEDIFTKEQVTEAYKTLYDYCRSSKITRNRLVSRSEKYNKE